MDRILSFMMVCAAIELGQATQPPALNDEQILELRASIPKMDFDSNAKAEDRVQIAFDFCKSLSTNRLQPSFAAAIFCRQLDKEFDIKSPPEWQRQLEREFVRPERRSLSLPESSSNVKIIKGKILGLSKTLVWPSKIGVPEFVTAVETSDRIYVVGFNGTMFTDVFVFQRATGEFLFAIPFSGSVARINGTVPPNSDYFVDVTMSAAQSMIHMFWICHGSVNLVAIEDKDTPVVKELYCSLRK